MRLLITGICGFVGSTLAKVWLEADATLCVYGLDNFIRPGSEENRIYLQKLGIKLFHGDIRVASDFETLPKVDWVIDAAANPSVLAGVDGYTSSRQLIEHNLFGTVNILEYCKKHGAGFIMLSTSRVYSITPLSTLIVEPVAQAFRLSEGQLLPSGLSSAGVSEAFPTAAPISLYGSTKLASEILALEYGETFNFPVWINRCGVMAGAGQFGKADQGIFAYWINAYLYRQPLKYIGFGGCGFQVRDCLHPRDLIPLLQKQTATPGGHVARLVNIGGGISNAMSLAELSAWCTNLYGSHSIASEPAIRRFDIPWLIMDYGLANQIWNWRPQTPLNKILDEIACHAQQHPNWLEISGASL
jgi:CDP-paratose 2-epimerase